MYLLLLTFIGDNYQQVVIIRPTCTIIFTNKISVLFKSLYLSLILFNLFYIYLQLHGNHYYLTAYNSV